MTNKTLTIIETAYRGTLEEQDDTVLWITTAMRGAGGEFTVLLRGNAVNYAVKAQKAPALSFGAWKQNNPTDITGDVQRLMGKGVELYVVEEDVAMRGLERSELIENVKSVSRSGVAKLVDQHERVWYW
jgi:intracellular sulfur oxidation DsrE/DsrF family protein